jgi:hypothetical protein
VEPPISAAQNNLSGADGREGITGPIKTVNMAELRDRTYCENVIPTGSRIVRGRRCYSQQDMLDREERTAQQMEQVRRDQEELERRARDLEEQRRRRL